MTEPEDWRDVERLFWWTVIVAVIVILFVLLVAAAIILVVGAELADALGDLLRATGH